VQHDNTADVALDTSKLHNAVAIAEGRRDGEVRYLGEIDNTPAAAGRLVRKLAKTHARLTFCYEAGPTGYGLYRHITSLGHDCIVVAPSLIPQRPGVRVKTNRRDALSLARQLRAGDLTPVWVPDPHHEAVRDLTRTRGAAVKQRRVIRQQISALLLRLGQRYPGKSSWGKAHRNWLTSRKLTHIEQRIALEEMLQALRQTNERIARLEQAIRAAMADWSLTPTATALMALRGIDLIAATTLVAEIGALTRFRTPRELMAWLGLVPSEQSTGERVKRGAITQDRQPPRAQPAGGMRLELPSCAAGRRRQRGETRSRAGRRGRDCLEGANPAERALQGAASCRQARCGCDHRGGARTRGLRLGGRPGDRRRGDAAGIVDRRGTGADKHRARVGARRRQGNSRGIAEWPVRPPTDARTKTQYSPRRNTDLRNQHAHQRSLTDVSAPRPRPCTIIVANLPNIDNVWKTESLRESLTKDMRAISCLARGIASSHSLLAMTLKCNDFGWTGVDETSAGQRGEQKQT
jgi:transposase